MRTQLTNETLQLAQTESNQNVQSMKTYPNFALHPIMLTGAALGFNNFIFKNASFCINALCKTLYEKTCA
jgi:hypothetical protein